jgi:hypothetical protein
MLVHGKDQEKTRSQGGQIDREAHGPWRRLEAEARTAA